MGMVHSLEVKIIPILNTVTLPVHKETIVKMDFSKLLHWTSIINVSAFSHCEIIIFRKKSYILELI
jgi:hypothetical protein